MDMRPGTAEHPSSPPLDRAERRRRAKLQTVAAIYASRELLNIARLAVLARRVTTMLPDIPLETLTSGLAPTRSLVRLPGWHWCAVIHQSDPENDTAEVLYWDVEQLAAAPLVVLP